MSWILSALGGLGILVVGYWIVKSESDRLKHRAWLNEYLLRESKMGVDQVSMTWPIIK